ncbi:MAG: prolipoprotein diacylglyceryl transferase [Gammaproteobacteria bacterium]|nr:prolipoprotein diacylglyceryl transferase [Gammaproteobacteria bacterium]
MIQYPGFDSVALQIGPLAIRWYGLMYLIGFGGGWWLARRRATRPASPCTVAQVDDLLFYVALGVILGGRVGYMLFYNWAQLADEPFSLFYIWQGGMSFHGGFLGVLLGVYLYGRKIGRGFWELIDFVAPLAPIGLGAGRLGNFINGELWGRPTALPWGMQVNCSDPRFGDLCYRQLGLPGDALLTPPLHPSPLYEAFLEGLVLFVLLWVFSAKPRPVRAVSALFLLGYGIFRSLVELVRLPDSHIDYLAFGWVTMGHVLTLPMILIGILLLWLAYRQPRALASGKPG